MSDTVINITIGIALLVLVALIVLLLYKNCWGKHVPHTTSNSSQPQRKTQPASRIARVRNKLGPKYAQEVKKCSSMTIWTPDCIDKILYKPLKELYNVDKTQLECIVNKLQINGYTPERVIHGGKSILEEIHIIATSCEPGSIRQPNSFSGEIKGFVIPTKGVTLPPMVVQPGTTFAPMITPAVVQKCNTANYIISVSNNDRKVILTTPIFSQNECQNAKKVADMCKEGLWIQNSTSNPVLPVKNADFTYLIIVLLGPLTYGFSAPDTNGKYKDTPETSFFKQKFKVTQLGDGVIAIKSGNPLGDIAEFNFYTFNTETKVQQQFFNLNRRVSISNGKPVVSPVKFTNVTPQLYNTFVRDGNAMHGMVSPTYLFIGPQLTIG